VEQGTPVVKVFFWNKGEDGNRKWNRQMCYHPQCYVDQAMDYLNRNPYVPHERGPKPTLSEEDRIKRTMLLRRFHSIQQRRNKLNGDYPDKLLEEAKLDRQALEVAMGIAKVGGIPPKWVEKLG